jgi:hypothetical protein
VNFVNTLDIVLGHADLVEQRSIGTVYLISVVGCKSPQCTFVLRGPSKDIISEAMNVSYHEIDIDYFRLFVVLKIVLPKPCFQDKLSLEEVGFKQIDYQPIRCH